MKIEINIDIEAIVREEIRNYVKENIVINNVPGATSHCSIEEADVLLIQTNKVRTPKPVSSRRTATPPAGVEWEYAKQPGLRRTPEIQALHELEVKLGRRLLPEEKGQTKAVVEMDEAAEEKAKQDAIKKVHIDKLAEEGMKAAAEEEARLDAQAAGSIPEEPKTQPVTQFINGVEQPQNVEEEATIPIADPLPKITSLFNK